MKKKNEQKTDAFLDMNIERIRSEINNHLMSVNVKNTFFLPLFVILFFISFTQTNVLAKYVFWIIALCIVFIDLFVAAKHYLHIRRRQKDLNLLLTKKKAYLL